LKLPHNRPWLYLISNRQAFRLNPEISDDQASQLQIETIQEATQAGCQLVQIREKDLSTRELCALASAVIDVARPNGAKVLINHRLDVAIATGADGVHLRVSSMPASEARGIVAGQGLNDFLIAVSTHSLAEAQAAESGGADFVVCGPVFATQSKREYGPALGLERFSEICKSVKIPVLALGGINLSNFRETLERGASGIAAIGLFTDRKKLRMSIQAIRADNTGRQYGRQYGQTIRGVD
jgi:thiamine-phosphate diphosphorylase